MKYGLSEAALRKILTVFHRHAEIDKVILYGSRAMGTAQEGSDIDITLLAAPEQEINLGSVAADLDELNLPYLFDLSCFTDLENKELIEHIHHHGQVVYRVGEAARIG